MECIWKRFFAHWCYFLSEECIPSAWWRTNTFARSSKPRPQNRFTLPQNTNTFTSPRNVLCAEAKAKLETELSLASFIALTADCWTPLTNASYKTVTAHYITRSLKWFRMFFLLWFSKSVTHRKTLQHIWKPSLKIRKFRKSKFQGLSRIMQQISRELYSVLPNSRDFSRFQGYLSRAWEKCRDSTKSGISPGILPIKIFFYCNTINSRKNRKIDEFWQFQSIILIPSFYEDLIHR